MTQRIQRAFVGDPLLRRLTAGAFNQFADAADYTKRMRESVGVQAADKIEKPALTVMVDNITADQSFDRLDVVGLDSPAIEPADGLYDFQHRSIWNGVVPTATHTGHLFGIAQEAFAPKTSGRVMTEGVTACRLFVPSGGESIDYADVDTTDNTRLRSVDSGSARILWKESGQNAVVNASVRLNSPAPGEGAEQDWEIYQCDNYWDDSTTSPVVLPISTNGTGYEPNWTVEQRSGPVLFEVDPTPRANRPGQGNLICQQAGTYLFSFRQEWTPAPDGGTPAGDEHVIGRVWLLPNLGLFYQHFINDLYPKINLAPYWTSAHGQIQINDAAASQRNQFIVAGDLANDFGMQLRSSYVTITKLKDWDGS